MLQGDDADGAVGTTHRATFIVKPTMSIAWKLS